VLYNFAGVLEALRAQRESAGAIVAEAPPDGASA
jgi:hypothetical protein